MGIKKLEQLEILSFFILLWMFEDLRKIEKFKKGWKYGAGAGLLKRGVGTFPIYFCQGLSCLHLEITLSFAKLY